MAGLIFISNQILKNKEVEKKRRSRKWIIISSLILFPILGFLYFSYLFGIALDDHYDVKKGTFLWYATMDNKTITEFPIIDPVGSVKYNSIGGDSPSIGTGWGIEYKSNADSHGLTGRIIEYLKVDGYEIKEVNETQYYWIGRHKKANSNQLFSGYNQKGESLDLMFQLNQNGTTEIKCTIVY